MTRQEKDIAISNLTKEVDAKQQQYEKLLKENAGYVVRKNLRMEMRQLKEELDRIGKLQVI